MSPEEFEEKCFFVESYVETENGATLEGLTDQFVLGADGLPTEWYPKITDGMTEEQRNEMAALIPDTHTGWLAAFRQRLLES